LHHLKDGIGNRVGVFTRGDEELEFIPEPLAGTREIEVMAFDGVAVCKSDFAARGMPRIVPVSSFQHHGVEYRHLDHLAAYPVNLHPVARMHAVASHEHEPADKADDEV